MSTSLHYVSGEDFYWILGGMKVLNEKIKKDKNEKQTQNYKQQQKQTHFCRITESLFLIKNGQTGLVSHGR